MFQRKVHASRPAAATDRRGPPWQLLVESPDPGLAISNFDAFRQAGFEVTVCGGPGLDPHECPVVRGEACPLMAGADVVLFDLDGDPPRRAELLAASRSEVLAAMRANRPGLPVVVMSAGLTPDTAAGCTAIRPTTSVGGQVSALQKAVMQWPNPQA
jgi:hypothetical protein